jgi:uncharacterized protein YyaL (SSP411 family)
MANQNRLANETSPYLLQHANNPVDWYPWGPEALQKALDENKPILVSIGYAACHWCHVMEHESFEDVQTALLMNKYFVCIKVDREERPDLDHLFMDALIAISGHGGWPLNMFLTPEGRPFYGGTYYPPVRYQNRISWKELLMQISNAFITRRGEIDEQAGNLFNHLKSANFFDPEKLSLFDASFKGQISKKDLELILERIMSAADQVEGGFGNAPKFPQTFTISYLLRCFHFWGDKPALKQALLSLKKMMQGGIYDQVGGGFCRYSTDKEWLVPHFEKMTYDNALIIISMAEAFQITGDQDFKKTIYQTIDFLQREMMNKEAAFYSAIDADSEGVEGKFYMWTLEEFQAVLGEDAPIMAAYYDILKEGNWEGVNIPRVGLDIEVWRKAHHLDQDAAADLIARSNTKLLKIRSLRVRPLTDDKILLGWNALMSQALIKAAVTFSDLSLLEIAKKNMDFLFNTFHDPIAKQWKHTYKAGSLKINAFLDDLAYLCQALLDLYEPTGDLLYLERAISIMSYIDKHFLDENQLHYYFSPDFQDDLLVRKKDLYDGALPSGNAVMAANLRRVGLLTNNSDMIKRSEKMILFMRDQTIKNPLSNGYWAKLLIEHLKGTNEILILGKSANAAGFNLLREFIPNKVMMAADLPNPIYPLMKGKYPSEALSYYLCRDYTCRIPLYNERDIINEIKKNN